MWLKKLRCLEMAKWRCCMFTNWDDYRTPSAHWNIDEGERSVLALRDGSSSTSQAAAAMLNCNDTHRSNFFVYILVGADYQQQRDLRLSRAAICIYYHWQNKGINIIAQRKKKKKNILPHGQTQHAIEAQEMRWKNSIEANVWLFIRAVNMTCCLSHPL